MESIQPSTRPAGLDKGHPGDAHSTRPRASSERDLMRISMSSQRPNENHSPANFSRACEGMLKTTTETGDIGMFSIKPSRVPQSLGTPRRLGTSYNPETGHQKSRQNFQPYGVPAIDDRRRLPSYARDASSEIISMYESASQKSGSRVFDEPDYRSYSMTQTSYSSYTLSNHRSYNSLRSQADSNTQVQRPRSPFAYPARLKRPGFRPSSPALTDGGIVDYSRRAEIERIHPGHNTSSPSSLYAQKRRPHQSLRPDGNRSTPSLLSQSSPPRRSSSPLVPRNNGVSSHDWARRPGPTSVNTSPARSTFSLASTANLYTSAQPPSTTTTPGKVPPSPRYYDYTEEFEVQSYNEPVAMDPPPLFRIDKTIPEDRPMSSGRPLAKEHGPEINYDAFQYSPPVRSTPLKSHSDKVSPQSITETKEESVAMQLTPSDVEAVSPEKECSPSGRKSVRLSGLGYGAQLLRSHVDEAFGNFPSSALEITNPNEVEHGSVAESKSVNVNIVNGSLDRDKELQSARSSYSVITSIPHFPSPPNDQDILQCKNAVNMVPETELISLSMNSLGFEESIENPIESAHPCQTKHQVLDTSHIDILKSLSEVQKKTMTSGSNHRGLAGTGPEYFAPTVALNRKQSALDDSHSERSSMRRTSMTSPTVPNVFNLEKTDPEQSHTSPMSLLNGRKAGDGQNVPQIQPLKRYQYHENRRLDLSGRQDLEATTVPNFSHQISRKEMARSESPLIAPKPISPARQLKLKNSVPQLMKALPPLPPDPPSRPESPTSSPEGGEIELVCSYSLIERDLNSASRPVKAEVPMKFISPKLVTSAKNDKKGKTKIAETVPTGTAAAGVLNRSGDSKTRHPLPRMKLKVKSSIYQRPISPPESRPWNLAENYPWSSPAPSVRLPSSVVPGLPVPISKPPRFKLKITRASNSTQGTVRVNRESAESKPLAGVHLHNPKDLFTPPTGLDNIFRQVSRHLHSRRTSVASTFSSQNDGNLPPHLPLHSTSTACPPVTSPSFTQIPSLPANLPSNSEARSVFSDDSSRGNGNRSLRLRGRLSNLKTKIAAPYANRAGAQSYDDITWRDRQGTGAPIPAAARSIPDLHAGKKIADSLRPMRRLVEKARRQKLKTKVQVQSWLKEAKSAIVTRVRTHSTTED
ncbi:uncharacterized protein RCO7_06061 [Rhynchosporium graminicola]|uniref:Uncharacterized protein n=1 Tax=Rhynchosporium graminicola TaxID=2792576 RepID=A0A1E1KXN8_9HELO|nr:uncharacterized protein RCO7_06061 [Rhynchosporium commune]